MEGGGREGDLRMVDVHRGGNVTSPMQFIIDAILVDVFQIEGHDRGIVIRGRDLVLGILR